MLQLLYPPQGKSHHIPFDRRLGGHQSQSGISGKEKNPCPCQLSNPGCLVHSSVAILTEIPQFLNNKHTDKVRYNLSIAY